MCDGRSCGWPAGWPSCSARSRGPCGPCGPCASRPWRPPFPVGKAREPPVSGSPDFRRTRVPCRPMILAASSVCPWVCHRPRKCREAGLFCRTRPVRGPRVRHPGQCRSAPNRWDTFSPAWAAPFGNNEGMFRWPSDSGMLATGTLKISQTTVPVTLPPGNGEPGWKSPVRRLTCPSSRPISEYPREEAPRWVV